MAPKSSTATSAASRTASAAAPATTAGSLSNLSFCGTFINATPLKEEEEEEKEGRLTEVEDWRRRRHLVPQCVQHLHNRPPPPLPLVLLLLLCLLLTLCLILTLNSTNLRHIHYLSQSFVLFNFVIIIIILGPR